MPFNKNKLPLILLVTGLLLAIPSTIISIVYVLQLGGTLNPITYIGFVFTIAGLIAYCFKYGAEKGAKMKAEESQEEQQFKAN